MKKWLIVSYVIAGAALVLMVGIIVGLSLPTIMFVGTEVAPVHPNRVGNASSICNITIANELVSDYYIEHQYYVDVYDCDQMASDLWDQAMALGLKAKLVVGSVNRTMPVGRGGLDHAWVIVMIENDKWLALDPTAGSFFLYSDEPKYYTGKIFDNPAKMQDFLYHYTPNGEPVFTNIKHLENPPNGY